MPRGGQGDFPLEQRVRDQLYVQTIRTRFGNNRRCLETFNRDELNRLHGFYDVTS